jgi:hypothetical protein
MPEPDMGVVGYTTTLAAGRGFTGRATVRTARPGRTLGAVRETTIGGKVWMPGALWARAPSFPEHRPTHTSTPNPADRAPII